MARFSPAKLRTTLVITGSAQCAPLPSGAPVESHDGTQYAARDAASIAVRFALIFKQLGLAGDAAGYVDNRALLHPRGGIGSAPRGAPSSASTQPLTPCARLARRPLRSLTCSASPHAVPRASSSGRSCTATVATALRTARLRSIGCSATPRWRVTRWCSRRSTKRFVAFLHADIKKRLQSARHRAQRGCATSRVKSVLCAVTTCLTRRSLRPSRTTTCVPSERSSRQLYDVTDRHL